jgi:hypothetical protein
MTKFGNTWVSNYDWGWVPFHNGRWYFDDYFQSWAWVPGYEWGPAWVNWRTGGGYYGWAPLGPGAFINVSVGLPAFHWVFLPRHRIYHPYAFRYYAPYTNRVRIYNNTTIINNTYSYNNQTYVTGLSRREVQRVTGRNVPVYQVNNSAAPGRASVSRNALNVYRPKVQNSRGTSVGARPSRILEADQAKSARSPQKPNSSTPSSTSAPSANSEGRILESPSRTSINSDGSVERTSPSRPDNPAVNQGIQRPLITPMPDDSRSRDTYTAPGWVQSSVGREEAPARSTQVKPMPSPSQRMTASPSRPSNEIRSMKPRTQPSTPARESVQQSRPAQAVKYPLLNSA